MSLTNFRKAKIKSSSPTWNCELCDYISNSKRQAELHAKFSHKAEDYKIKTPSKKDLKKLRNDVEEGYCILRRKSMKLHSKNRGNCP